MNEKNIILIAALGFGAFFLLTRKPAAAQPAAAPTAPPPPPPLAAAKVWHVAENGATKGPFGEADLAAMAANGGLGQATMVWTAGQDGWKPASETELARLFASAAALAAFSACSKAYSARRMARVSGVSSEMRPSAPLR